MSNNNNYKPGNPEYDFWNDKNLYPDLKNDYDDNSRHHSARPSAPEDTKIGFGTVFVAVFTWIFLLAPFALFFTWQDWIVQLVFWGGLMVIIIILAACFYNKIEEYKEK